MSKISVTTIAGLTSGGDANTVKIESGDTLEVVSNATVGGDLTVDTSTLKVDSSNNNVGIGETSPLGKLHIKSGDSAASSVNGNANELVVENSDYTGITVLGENETSIMFGDNEDPDVGRIVYFHGTNTMSFMTNTNNAMHIDSTGAVTKPKQPAFLARPASDQDGIAINADIVVVFGTEIFDQNADFSSNTFTAPVDGRYHLDTSIYCEYIDTGASIVYVTIVTSNRTYFNVIDPNFSADATYWTFLMSVLADMDANDTAQVKFTQIGGTAQANVHRDSHFSGYLVC